MRHDKIKEERLKAYPFIIDDVLTSRPAFVDRARFEQITTIGKRAERFLFSPAASGLIGRFCVDCGDLIMGHRQFARPPYSEMYIEFQQPFLDALPKTVTDPVTGETRTAAVGDERIGYLISGARIYVFYQGTYEDGTSTGMSSVFWTWAAPGSRAIYETPERGRPISFTGPTAEWNHLAIILGSAMHKLKDEDMRESILAEAHPHVFPGAEYLWRKVGGQDYIHRTLQERLQGTGGDIRNIWAALLWLNRPAHTLITNQPAGRRFLKGKQVAFRQHRVVEIDLHKHRSIRRAFTLSGERLSPINHRVRGAFHHSGGQFSCSHEWPLMPDVDGHWKCHKCGRLRWWVREHRRGDRSRGTIEHTYGVTTGDAAVPASMVTEKTDV